MPPPYSAKKIDGKPAYAIARAGQTPLLKPARVVITELTFAEVKDESVTFAMQISAGGYVRSVAHELGQRLGCGGHLASLRRTAAGPFLVEQACTLEALQQAAEASSRSGCVSSGLQERLIHPQTLLPNLGSVTADAATLLRLRNGMQVYLPEFSGAPEVKVFASQTELAAIAKRVAGTLFQPVVVLS